MDRNITVIEGCMPDTPRQLSFEILEDLDIPVNVRTIFNAHKLHPVRYILHARFDEKGRIIILDNPKYSRTAEPSKIDARGWRINEYVENFRWIFDAQRAIITQDRRVYVHSEFFKEGWRFYVEGVENLVNSCNQIFSGEKTLNDFYENPVRI